VDNQTVEEIARYIESESGGLMEIVVGETKHDYGLRLTQLIANNVRAKFKVKVPLPSPPLGKARMNIVYYEDCKACDQRKWLNDPNTDLDGAHPSVIPHTCPLGKA
jgi:hypothetical protein